MMEYRMKLWFHFASIEVEFPAFIVEVENILVYQLNEFIIVFSCI